MTFVTDLMKKLVEESVPTAYNLGIGDEKDDHLTLVVSYELTPHQENMLHIIDEEED